MIKKLRILIPTVVLFASPWMHKAIYNNLMLAWPGTSSDFAHWFGIIGAGMAFFITALMCL